MIMTYIDNFDYEFSAPYESIFYWTSAAKEAVLGVPETLQKEV